jgi:hypothetical protein
VAENAGKQGFEWGERAKEAIGRGGWDALNVEDLLAGTGCGAMGKAISWYDKAEPDGYPGRNVRC